MSFCSESALKISFEVSLPLSTHLCDSFLRCRFLRARLLLLHWLFFLGCCFRLCLNCRLLLCQFRKLRFLFFFFFFFRTFLFGFLLRLSRSGLRRSGLLPWGPCHISTTLFRAHSTYGVFAFGDAAGLPSSSPAESDFSTLVLRLRLGFGFSSSSSLPDFGSGRRPGVISSTSRVSFSMAFNSFCASLMN